MRNNKLIGAVVTIGLAITATLAVGIEELRVATAHSRISVASSVALTTPRNTKNAVCYYNGYGALGTAYAKVSPKAC